MGRHIGRIGPFGVPQVSEVRWDLAWPPSQRVDPRELVLGLRAIAWFFCTRSEAAFIGVTDDLESTWKELRQDWLQLAVLAVVEDASDALWTERHLIQSLRQHEAPREPEKRRFVHQGLGHRHRLDGDGPWLIYACRR